MKHSVSLAAVLAFIAFGPVNLSANDTADKKSKYPLKTCVVTDEKLGGHGKPYVFQHEGQEVQLCCKGCLKDFKKDAAKYMKKIKAGK